MERKFIGPVAGRAYSSIVMTRGGTTLWLAGHTGTVDESGVPLSKFDDQVRQTFKNIEATLKRAGGQLSDMVTMTVYILDVRHGDRFVELRREILTKDFPASALVTVAGFARPEIQIEIMPVAVIP
jgi:enamine deaminase RidA (YjgF/YER057c/UK114 family)